MGGQDGVISELIKKVGLLDGAVKLGNYLVLVEGMCTEEMCDLIIVILQSLRVFSFPMDSRTPVRVVIKVKMDVKNKEKASALPLARAARARSQHEIVRQVVNQVHVRNPEQVVITAGLQFQGVEREWGKRTCRAGEMFYS